MSRISKCLLTNPWIIATVPILILLLGGIPPIVLANDCKDTQQPEPASRLTEENTPHIESSFTDFPSSYSSFIEEEDWVGRIWGRPSRDRLYLGMWTHHIQPGKDQVNKNNLLGVAWQGYYGGTLINSHGDRVVSAGWQRTLYQRDYGDCQVEAGYRAGMIYGYQKYLQLFNTRFFPLFQTVLGFDYKRFGVEFTWAGVVFTAGLYYRL